MKASILLIAVGFFLGDAKAQSILFDFDNAPLHSPLPVDLTVGGVTAHFSGNPSFYNYSIQRADALGFTPAGFAGYCVYPNTVFPCDLLVSFNHTLNAISIMYAPEEYATDSSCTMRITAYLGANYVGTSTFRISEPSTWPTGILAFSSLQPFDNVVIHYDAPPVTGGDYGPIFMADNLQITVAASPLQLTSAVSRKTHGGAGIFDVDLPLTGPPGVECRYTGGNYTIVLTANNNLVSGGASVTAGTGAVSASPTFAGNSMIVQLTGVTDAQQIAVTFTGITDSFAQVMSDTVVSVNILVGDTTGNKTVNSSDVSQTKTQSGLTVTSANFRADLNVNGQINGSDVSFVKSKSGNAIP